jgi:hypothetical protein
MQLTKKFNLYFFIFINLIFLLAIFYLYEKHLVGNDSTISEWIINYQGGFTRRGLIGEICFKIAIYFDLNLRFVIFIFQSSLYLLFTILVYNFFKNTPKNIISILAIYSPIFLLYPIAEIEVLARKEIFMFIAFIIFLNISSLKISNNYLYLYIFFIFPIICLIWEPFIFFFTFALFIILLRNSTNEVFYKKIFKIFLSFSSSLILIFFIITNLLTPEEHEIMVNSLMDNFGEKCYMSCAFLKSKSSIKAQFDSIFFSISPIVVIRYFFILLIGFLPLLIMLYNSNLSKEIIFFSKKISLLIIFIFLFLPTIVLFASGSDWGRWVNISYTFSILTYFYLIKNNYINFKDEIVIFDNFYQNKRKLFIIMFIIFAFGWNQKTSITGDVGTNSVYKILYNTSKRIFNFGSIRLFEDYPIIKFHKKYIE